MTAWIRRELEVGAWRWSLVVALCALRAVLIVVGWGERPGQDLDQAADRIGLLWIVAFLALRERARRIRLANTLEEYLRRRASKARR